jgi:hypothetical protein
MERKDAPTSTSEIEITPAMIAAGCDALWDSDYGLPTVGSVDVVAAILWAALEAGGFSPKRFSDQPVE